MLVIGNGSSRKDIPIDYMHQEKIGCNAIFRDHYVQHLVCCWNKELGVLALPNLIAEGTERMDQPFHWGSGPYAVLLGATLDNKISLLGFDLYSDDNKVNNIYKGTEGYSSADSHAVDHSYWVHQIAKVFEWFPQKTFRIYNKENWNMPKEWNLANVSLDTLNNL